MTIDIFTDATAVLFMFQDKADPCLAHTRKLKKQPRLSNWFARPCLLVTPLKTYWSQRNERIRSTRMVVDALGYRNHAEVACGVLGYGGCGVVGVVMDLIVFATMGVSLCVGVAALVAVFQESDTYFNAKPSWDRIGSYRLPYFMMIAVGLCLVPVIGIMYALAMWMVYFSGKRFG